MSVAFDFSIEELWVPLAAGATIVPNTASTSLFGEELADFLESRGVTCFCCVPTLLASMDRDLPQLRILLIGGEACPPALVKRWSRPGRALLNSYGPAEATVTATLGRLSPEKPVTIGRPLPTYSIVILDPLHDEAVELGAAGEIGIAGIGVAEGYLNLPELTAAKFIPDFLALANNPSGRIYRSGDLGRINEEREIEYLGRIDTQVKLRGYRVELTEIESVLLEIPEIAQAVVTTFAPEPSVTELVAYYSVKPGAVAPEPGAIAAFLRAQLPAYMTPAYLERLPVIPTQVSNKVDREKLPTPLSTRLLIGDRHAPPSTPTEELLCRALSETLDLEEVSVDSDFFEDYGAHSLLMARFCAKVRQLEPSMHVAMRDVYMNPTVRRLARAVDAVKPLEAAEPELAPAHRPSNLAYYGCGGAQAAFYFVIGALGFGLVQLSFEWTYAAVDSALALYVRALAVVAALFFGLEALAVAAKWLLIGRARPQVLPIWSFAYFRFWAAKQLVQLAPANVFAGTPIFNVHLRLLGAKIGRRAVVDTSDVPIAADLFSVGDDAVIAKRALLAGLLGARQSPPHRRNSRRQRTPTSARRASSTFARRSAISANWAMRRRCAAASACPRESAITARRPRRRRRISALPTKRPPPRCAARCSPPGSFSSRSLVAGAVGERAHHLRPRLLGRALRRRRGRALAIRRGASADRVGGGVGVLGGLDRRRPRGPLRLAAPRPPLPEGGPRLPALRLPPRHAANGGDLQQFGVLQSPVRRQRLH